jgi:hypothetical protein
LYYNALKYDGKGILNNKRCTAFSVYSLTQIIVALDATSEDLNNSEGEIFCHPQNLSYKTNDHSLKNCGI